MKAIFKKNQIIITALAIMIAVVGYLNFAKDKEAEKTKEDALSAAGNSLQEGQNVSDGENGEGDEYGDLSAEDLGEDQYFMYQVSDTGELILSENNAEAGKEGTKKEDSEKKDNSGAKSQGESNADEKKTGTEKGADGENTAAGTDGENAAAGANGEDLGIEGAANSPLKGEGNATLKGEANPSENKDDGADSMKEAGSDGIPGEAVFTSVTLQGGYFSSAKLGREQMRAKNKEILMSVVSDINVTDEIKQNAINEIIAITARAEMENAAEILLEAKGYEGVVVSLSESEVDVVVNAASITEQQIAQIEDIVSRKTGIKAEGIVITTVVTEE